MKNHKPWIKKIRILDCTKKQQVERTLGLNRFPPRKICHSFLSYLFSKPRNQVLTRMSPNKRYHTWVITCFRWPWEDNEIANKMAHTTCTESVRIIINFASYCYCKVSFCWNIKEYRGSMCIKPTLTYRMLVLQNWF